jgi:hypothetical protein
MQPLINKVIAREDYTLILFYKNKEKRIFDMKPLLRIPPFNQLVDMNLFNSVKPSFDSIQWGNEIDIDPEYVYAESEKFEDLSSQRQID